MFDPRITKLANVLVNYSCEAKKGEKILIEAIDVPHEFTCECIRLAKEAGAIPVVKLDSNQVKRALMLNGSQEGWELIAETEKFLMKQVQCYISARGNHNISELSDVSDSLQQIYFQNVWQKVHREVRVPHTRWVVIRWPTPSMAQQAGLSTEAFEDFYFDVCTMDYKKMAEAMKPLVARMEKAEKVHIKGPNDTDLTFSIKGIPVVSCHGRRNIPDGEVYTAPVKNSVNGVIQYNAPSIYRGETHNDVRFVFQNGKIIEATSSNTQKLNALLNTDQGARYVGEFAIGLNPFCSRAMKDSLFDEKISGSIHLTPGAAYKKADNGNTSNIHWDLVMIQTPNFGGGEIYFDGELIRKEGLFVVDDLKSLNPDLLK